MTSLKIILLNVIIILNFKLLNVYLSKIDLMIALKPLHFAVIFVCLLCITHLLKRIKLMKTIVNTNARFSFCDLEESINIHLNSKNNLLQPALLMERETEQKTQMIFSQNICDSKLTSTETFPVTVESQTQEEKEVIIQERTSNEMMATDETLLPPPFPTSENVKLDHRFLLPTAHFQAETFEKELKLFQRCPKENTTLFSPASAENMNFEEKINSEIQTKVKIESEIRSNIKIEIEIRKNIKSHQSTSKKGFAKRKAGQKSILSQRHTKNIEIFLKKLIFYRKGEDSDQHKEIYRAILAMEEKIFTEEILESLVSVFPPKSELEKLKKSNKNELCETERFVITLCQIPDCQKRLRLMIFSLKCEKMASEVLEEISAIRDGLTEILRNNNFITVLTVLNEKPQRGNAKGFEIDALKNLDQCTSKKYKNALNHIVSYMRENHADETPFYEDFEKISAAFKVKQKHVEETIEAISSNNELLEMYIELEKEKNDRFNDKMRPFSAKLKSNTQLLLSTYDEYERFFAKMTDDKRPWQNFFDDIQYFTLEYQRIEHEIRAKENREKRSKRQRSRTSYYKKCTDTDSDL